MQLILTLVCFVIIVYGVLCGFARRSNRMFFRLITLVASAVGAFFLAKVGMEYAGGYIISFVRTCLQGNEWISSFLAENPDFADALFSVVQMLLAPLLFLIFYMLLKMITLLPYKILCFILRIKGPRFFGRLTGAVAGFACGLLGVLVLVVPVCGYTSLVGDTLESLYPGEQQGTIGQIKQLCNLDEAPLAGTVYNMVGDVLFAQLTTANFGGEYVQLQGEIQTILSVLDNAKALGQNSIENYGAQEAAAVDGMVEGIGSSALLSHVGSALLSEVSGTWLEGDTFFGVARPEADANANGLINAFLRVFSTSNSENIGEDLGTFADIFDLMVKHDMFPLLSAATTDSNALAQKLTAPGVIDEFYGALNKNPRMAPVKAAIADVGVRVMMSQLGSSDELKENYGEMLSDMAGTIKSMKDENGNVDTVALKSELSTVLDTHEIQVDDAAVQLVADGIADSFTAEELETLTEDEMVDRLIERFTSAEAAGELAGALAGGTGDLGNLDDLGNLGDLGGLAKNVPAA